LVVATVALAVVGMTLAGCAKKTKVEDGSVYDASATGATGDEALGSQSSLERYRRGLSPEEGGVLKDVRFAYDSYELDANARDVLAANAQWLKENPGTRTEIEGHCDERGTIEYNLALGARRAKAANDYLVSLGVSADRLSTISYGEELPLCQDPSESCFARNRRVHFIPPTQ
jgi:peptidoglycan-associated lipoprotein